MNPGITEWLSDEQLQTFDADSINKIIEKYKATKELVEQDFDIDNNTNLTKEEKIIFKKIEENWTIVSDLEKLIKIVDDKSTIWSRFSNNVSNTFSWLSDSISESQDEIIKSMVENLMTKWNIPDNETLIMVLDKIQYLITWKEDKKVWELIKLIENSKEWDWFMRLEVSKYIWEYTWLIWTDLYNQVQEKMVEWALWNKENWFNDKYIIWFDKNDWYSIKKISEFENELKTQWFDNLNKNMLWNYLNYLNEFHIDINQLNINDNEKKYLIQTIDKRKELNNKMSSEIKKNIDIFNNVNTKYIDYLFENSQAWDNSKLNNTINKITDDELVLDSIKYIKSKDKNYNFVLSNIVHSSLLNDIIFLGKFNKLTWYTLAINNDIKNIDFKTLSNEETKILFDISREKTLIKYLISYNIDFVQKSNNYIKSIIWDKNMYIIDKVKSILNNKEKSNIEDIDAIQMNEFDYIENIQFDNTVYEWIKNNDKKIINKFLKAYSESSYHLITNFPKTFNLILKNESTVNIDKIINMKTDFYKLLPISIQKKHTVSYVKWIIKYNNWNIAQDLALIQFNNVKDMYITFTLLNQVDSKIKDDLLRKPLFLTNFNLFRLNHESKLINFKNQDFIQEIMTAFNLYIKEKKGLYKQYEDSIKATKEISKDKYTEKDENKNYELVNKAILLANKTNYTDSQKALLIVYCWEAITGDDWGKNNVIEDLFKQWLTQTEFKNLLTESNKILKELQQENNQELRSITIENNQKEELSSILSNWEIDITKLEKEAKEFLQSNLEIKLDNWNILKYPSSEWKNNILALYLNTKYKKVDNKLKWLVSSHLNLLIANIELQTQIKHSDKIYTAYKTWNFDEIDKLLQNNFKNALSNKWEKNKINKTTNKANSNTEKIQTNNKYSYFELNTNNQFPEIKLNTWEKIKISQKEAKIVKSNPETAKNIINFYKALNELWLNNLWTHRESISNSIWSQNWTSINNNDNSLSENELKIFLNSILSSVWEEKINTSWNINQFKNEFKNKNKVQVSWNFKDNLEIWSSNIEEKFMKKYITWFSKFQTSSFLKNIK